MDPIDFGPFPSILGTIQADKATVSAGNGYYGGAANDVLTCGSTPTFGDDFPNGGFVTNSVLMSGGQDNDKYKFDSSEYEWATIVDGGSGKDRVKFPVDHPFNPLSPDPETRIDVFYVNQRDVLIVSTDLNNGGRYCGVTFADPFGTLDPANKIERVLFGNKARSRGNKHSFGTFFSALKGNASSEEYSELYGFTETTYSELAAAGVVNLEGVDVSSLEDGSALQAILYNNSIIN